MSAGADLGSRLSVVGLAPGLEVLPRLLVRGRIKAENGTTLEHLLRHEILESGHLDCLVRDLVSEVRGNDHNSLAVANDHIAGKDRRITAADGPIDLDRLMQGEVGRSRGTIMVGREGELSQLRRVAKAAVRDDAGAAADHEPGDQDRAGGSGAGV